ncbi:MAG: glycosyltransferase family 2 protein [Candidatus Caldarchaeales archaeon]
MSIFKKLVSLIFSIIVTIVVGLSPQLINSLIAVDVTSTQYWALLLINISWTAFLATFVLPTTYFVTYAVLGRTSRRYGGNASVIAIPIILAIIGVLIIYYSPLNIITWIGYLVISLSLLAILLMIKNNEIARTPYLTIFEMTNGGSLPKVSVIIPAYNEESSIGDAIESVLNQTYPNTEVIVVDDGSIDKTTEIVSGYVRDNPDRVKLIRHEKNLGKFEALNTGSKNASGEYIYHMDADTTLDLDNIERILTLFKDRNVGAVASMVSVPASDDVNILTKLQTIEYLFEQLVVRYSQSMSKNVMICPGAGCIFRKEIADTIFVQDRTITEDADYTFEVRRDGWRIDQEVDAVSFTETPKTLKAFTKQRIRWLYGVLQTLRIHRWSIKDPWVTWAWLGYILTPLSMIILLSIPILGVVLGQAYLAYFAPYALMGFTIFVSSRAIPLALYRYRGKTSLLLYLPIYLIYNTYLSILTVYCFIAWITRRGVKINYGSRRIHVK